MPPIKSSLGWYIAIGLEIISPMDKLTSQGKLLGIYGTVFNSLSSSLRFIPVYQWGRLFVILHIKRYLPNKCSRLVGSPYCFHNIASIFRHYVPPSKALNPFYSDWQGGNSWTVVCVRLAFSKSKTLSLISYLALWWKYKSFLLKFLLNYYRFYLIFWSYVKVTLRLFYIQFIQ